MALLTPQSLYHVISLSILSRLIVFAIQLISNLVITDHNADAYRNRYHLALTKNATLPNTLQHFYGTIQGLTNWDSQYLLEISNDGYNIEQHLAFLPLFPVAISVCRQYLFEHETIKLDNLLPSTKLNLEDSFIPQIQLENYIRSAVVGFALNNFIFFPVASVTLFALTKLVIKKDEKFAKNVIWWFCFNPASIFFSACYTESQFAALTFITMFSIEYLSNGYHSGDEKSLKDEPTFFADYNRILKICLPSVIPLALSGATRSNGLVTIGFIYYQFMLKYVQVWQSIRSRLPFSSYVCLAVECIQDLIALAMLTVVAASGYITFQIYSYIKFCAKDTPKKKGVLNMKPEWCDNSFPHPYGQVQAKYWNVGPFQYYEATQLPNFLLAVPITYLVLCGSLEKSREIVKTKNGKRQLVYYLHGILLTLFCGTSINVQVTTRLLASCCPIVYWIAADWAQQSRYKNRLLITYFITYFILGTILHANFYPWT